MCGGKDVLVTVTKHPTASTVSSLLWQSFGGRLPLDDPTQVEVIVLLDIIQVAKMGGEKPSLILGKHDGLTILCTDQLEDITCHRLSDCRS